MDNKFLIASLFVPRITLIWYYFHHWIPANSIPFWGDFLAAGFVPRILILLYIYGNLGADNAWFWLHLVMAILCYGFGGSETKEKLS